MFQTLTTLFAQNSQRRQLTHNARLLDTQARATRIRGESQAARIEQAATQNQEIAGYNLRQSRANQRAAIGTVRTMRGGSGFTQAGTNNAAEQELMTSTDMSIANQAFSASIAMGNAWQAATDTRRQAAIDSDILTAKANAYRAAAKGTQRAMWATGISGVIGAAVGAYQASSANRELANSLHADEQAGLIDHATAKAAYDIGYQNPTMQGLQAADSFSHAANAFNPYTAALTGEFNNRRNNWGGFLSVLTGHTPYNITGANNLLYD